MAVHYIMQSIFVLAGLTALLASLFNSDWFFKSQHTQFMVQVTGRNKARLIYAFLGCLMIGAGVYFFLAVQGYL